MRRPVNSPYTITTEFGEPDSNAMFGKHSGVDYAVASGTSVFAPVSGTVTGYTWGQYHGYVVQILADDGKYHRLMHNSKLLVTPGQRVNEGQEVAKSGSTGLSTGPHVHWDVATQASPTSFAAFIGPATLLFAPAPQTNTVTFPSSVATWAVYKVGSGYRKGTSDQVGTILPSKFGGLTYPIVEKRGNVVVIDTESFGRVAAWVKDTEAIVR